MLEITLKFHTHCQGVYCVCWLGKQPESNSSAEIEQVWPRSTWETSVNCLEFFRGRMKSKCIDYFLMHHDVKDDCGCGTLASCIFSVKKSVCVRAHVQNHCMYQFKCRFHVCSYIESVLIIFVDWLWCFLLGLGPFRGKGEKT